MNSLVQYMYLFFFWYCPIIFGFLNYFLMASLLCLTLCCHLAESLKPEAMALSEEFMIAVSFFIFCQGSLVGVCGSVGSGKSSLINAILGRVRNSTYSKGSDTSPC